MIIFYRDFKMLVVSTNCPAAGGLLTNIYVKGREGRFSINMEYQMRYDDPWLLETAIAFADLAGKSRWRWPWRG